MSLPRVASRQEWLAARKELLAEEKAMTRARDELNTKRRELPMVKVDKPYEFEGSNGTVGLVDLFEGRRQLIVQHFMFDPGWNDGCPSCTAGSDEISGGLLHHLHARDTTLAVVSRAPLAKLESYKAKRGWTFPWYSSFGSDFNYDFHVTIDGSVAPIEFNFRNLEELRAAGLGWLAEGSTEQPGYSVFLRVGDDVFHTYSMYARGTEQLGGSYYFLDTTPLGRQEDWEEPKGRADNVRGAVPNFDQ
ncbi:MAG TPA: DUF899 domain-containing protein [Acidimicrobiales bacterium]|jgi:predicted dithiol-disulfide oxidoreductase (DUF899 family)|nr:DUF899 domain-containing protein [Acidimicrobiales bacterium]